MGANSTTTGYGGKPNETAATSPYGEETNNLAPDGHYHTRMSRNTAGVYPSISPPCDRENLEHWPSRRKGGDLRYHGLRVYISSLEEPTCPKWHRFVRVALAVHLGVVMVSRWRHFLVSQASLTCRLPSLMIRTHGVTSKWAYEEWTYRQASSVYLPFASRALAQRRWSRSSCSKIDFSREFFS